MPLNGVESIDNLLENRTTQNIPQDSIEINIGIAPLNADQDEYYVSNTTKEVLTNDLQQYPTGIETEHCMHEAQMNCNEEMLLSVLPMFINFLQM